jgi:hypothetical protein
VIGLPEQKLATSFFSVNLLYDDKFSLCGSPVSRGASDNGTVLYYLIVKGRNDIYYCTSGVLKGNVQGAGGPNHYPIYRSLCLLGIDAYIYRDMLK